VETPGEAFEAAKAFGEFQRSLASLPPPRLHETIANFHNTPLRFAALEAAVSADKSGRVRGALPEIRFALDRGEQADALLRAGLPERTVHNDAKLNNVLLDDATDKALCVVDLDTVMPGLALSDFGDLMRTATTRSHEDERDLNKVEMQFPLFEALARGYLAAASSFLTREEKRHLVAAGKIITLEQGVRFLADYLAGDRYYKIHREAQNLDRCRTQFRMLESIDRQQDEMERLVEAIADR
jgi:aminoglycoside phosphotransferase (APT) family kinase protein